jgi:integrase
MPSVKRRVCVPAVYTPIEVEQLLAATERSTEIDKRNYAIILIATRLGLRASDIAGMTFSCLNYSNTTIRVVQTKGKNKGKSTVELPMLDDIKDALGDYIDNGRRQSQDEHIFINKRGYRQGMISPPTITQIVRCALNRAGIDCNNRKCGPYSLRSSLATALLSEGNDYRTIQKASGHKDIVTSKYYARADIDQLRPCALSVPAPAMKFKEFLLGVQ